MCVCSIPVYLFSCKNPSTNMYANKNDFHSTNATLPVHFS